MLWVLGGLVVVVLLAAWFFRFGPAAISPEEQARFQTSLEAFLATHHDAIESTRRPVVRIALVPMDADDPLASKVGGAPWWPLDEPLPRDAQGKPLALLAQVNLAEVPDSGLDLPAHGLLQFLVAPGWKFGQDYGRDESPAALAELRGHRIVYRPDPVGPTQAIALVSKKDMPSDPRRPLRMRFRASTETMSLSDDRFASLFPGGLDHALEAHGAADGLDGETLHDALGDRDDAYGNGHKLGGYPYFTQSDPRERTDLELLFQLDSDDGVMWGDAGVGNFFINDDDLARRDFSSVYYTWDCC